MGLISWMVTGLLVGVIARRFSPGRPGGLMPTLLLTAVGALIGGYVSSYFDYGTLAIFHPRALLAAFAGALVMVGVVRMLRI
ncbi:GlsB/YeaQ/YmgE family stress response membrane protein [Erwinia aphidicola]|jgi:uncharacterized membrane protein YeaQ/YmgE (transglycosylase-associated protein family)|uniref:Major facilitator superfamily (MFS) profile domain-containing protein n=1 Tax=Erwinia aphidicola TaxID=68334 RepID=A0ABU8D9P1_ERWAP|nr:hypothetical protein [uncultured Erwinia sp.]